MLSARETDSIFDNFLIYHIEKELSIWKRKQQKIIIGPFELFHEIMSKVRFNKKEDLDDVASYEELDRTVYGEEEGNKKLRTNSRSVPRK